VLKQSARLDDRTHLPVLANDALERIGGRTVAAMLAVVALLMAAI
jgi:hypothetical protein